MNINALREVADLVDIRSVASYLGLPVNHAGYINCPLHHEKTPSCKLYPEQGRFWCFGCESGGDAIDLTAAVHGCSKGKAAAELNERFNLNIDLGKHQSKIIKRKSQKQQIDLAEQLKAMADHCFDLHRYLSHCFGRLDALEDNLGDFCQRLLDDDDLRVSDPLQYYNKYRKEFIKYANAERRFFAIRDAIGQSRINGQPYPKDEILSILGRA